MRNFEYYAYTFRHRQAIKYLIFKLIKDDEVKKEMLKRATLHDMDKVILYQFLDKKEASNYHRLNSQHHMENDLPKTYFDKLEAILDYESAGYTKPDKPLNAFDTINRFKNEGKLDVALCEELLDICKEYGLNKSYSVLKDKEGLEYLKVFNTVSKKNIYTEIITYFATKAIQSN